MLTNAICDLDLVVFSVLTKTILILDRIKVNLEGFKPANLLDLFSSHLDLLVFKSLKKKKKKGLNPNRLI